jgi:hypothetical protein
MAEDKIKLSEIILSVLKVSSTPLKAKEIVASIVNRHNYPITTTDVNSLLYGELANSVSKDSEHRWSLTNKPLMSNEMTWRKAIEKVLSDTSEVFRSKDIVKIISQEHLRSNLRATPERTVDSVISTAIKKEGIKCPFQRVGKGLYIWKENRGKADITQPLLFGKPVKNISAKETSEKITSGGCSFLRTSPDKSALVSNTKVLNVIIPFDEALKLDLSLQDCLLKLNSIKMSTKKGKTAAVNISIHFHDKRIQILNAKQ